MEAYEKKLVTKEQTGGLEIKWASPETVVKLVQIIGNRQGIGDLLVEGVWWAAQKIGHGAEEFAMHVGGRNTNARTPRKKRSRSDVRNSRPRSMPHGMGARRPLGR